MRVTVFFLALLNWRLLSKLLHATAGVYVLSFVLTELDDGTEQKVCGGDGFVRCVTEKKGQLGFKLPSVAFNFNNPHQNQKPAGESPSSHS